MGFRRDGRQSREWKLRLDKYPELVQRARLPDFLFENERSWFYFLLHSYHQPADGAPPVMVLAMMSRQERQALYELLSNAYSDEERLGMWCWDDLKREFELPP